MIDQEFLAEKFSKLITDTKYDNIPDDVKESAKLILLDYLGNLIASKIADTSEIAIKIAENLGGSEECTILGSNKKVSAMNAVLANAMGGYSFDFVDDHNDSKAHPSPATIPAALNLSEKYNKSGKEFMEAYMVGNEVIARAGSAYLGNMNKQCFHPTSVLGTMGTIATACKVMGLDMEQCTNAQGIGINSMAAGLYAWNSFENNTKRVNAAQPARNGILAAVLAEGGIKGPKDVYEGRFGAFNAFGYNREWNLDQAVRDLGEEWQFANSSIKPYPACRYAGANIDACLDIINNNDIDLNSIKSIIAGTQSGQIELLMVPAKDKYNPKNAVDMQHSLPYCVAVALIKKKFSVDELDNSNLDNPMVKKLIPLVTAVVDEEMEAKYPDHYSTSITIIMNDDTKYYSVIDDPLGDWRNPVDKDFVISKFKSLAFKGIPDEDRVNKIIDYVFNIEKQENISDLMELINFR